MRICFGISAKQLSEADLYLAIDTATDHIGLSLDDGNQVLTERIWRSKRHHTTELAPEVALILRDAGIGPADLNGLAVAIGPGSYTGLRIGLALAKGLALAHGTPLVGVPTLDILAVAQEQAEQPLLAVIQAGRKRIAAVWYKWGRSGWQAQSEPESFTWDQVLGQVREPTVICGELGNERPRLEREKNVLLRSPAACVRRPSYLAEIARNRIADGDEDDPAALAPTYLGELEGA